MKSGATLGDIRAMLGWMYPDDPDEFLQTLNQARRSIIENGQWEGVNTTVIFNGSIGYITMPYFVASIVGITIFKVPALVFTEYNQYVESGPGTVDFTKPGYGTLQMLGDQFCTSLDHAVGQQLRFRVSNSGDAAQVVRIFGTDATGATLYDATGAEGQNLTLVSPVTTFPTALNTFDGFQKDATLGTVSVYSWNGTTETLLSTYQPGETRPHYTRYGTGTYDTTFPIACLCRIRYYPLVADTDFCRPDNVNALQSAMQAQDCQNTRNYDEAKTAWADCYQTLSDELRSLRGVGQPTVRLIGPMGNRTRVYQN